MIPTFFSPTFKSSRKITRIDKREGEKMKYEVSIRDKVEDWETPSDFWDDINYPEPYIEADCPEDAELTARDFKYEFLVTEYEGDE